MSTDNTLLSDILAPETEQALWKLLTTPQADGKASPLEEASVHMGDFMNTEQGGQIAGLVMRAMMRGGAPRMPLAF